MMDEEELVCMCMNISIKDIKKAVEAGAKTFADVQKQTSAGSVCGVCQQEIETTVTQVLNMQ